MEPDCTGYGVAIYLTTKFSIELYTSTQYFLLHSGKKNKDARDFIEEEAE